jgi:hypothetical protein
MARVLGEAGAFPRDADDTAYVMAVIDGTVVPVDELGAPPVSPLVVEPALHVIGPSPTGGTVTFTFAVPSPGEVTVEIFDVAGRRVARPVEGRSTAAVGYASWDGTTAARLRAPSGVYVARLTWIAASGGGAGAAAAVRLIVLR